MSQRSAKIMKLAIEKGPNKDEESDSSEDPFHDSDALSDLSYEPSDEDEDSDGPGYIEFTPPHLLHQVSDVSSSDSEPDIQNGNGSLNVSNQDNNANKEFGPVQGKQKNFQFTAESGINEALIAIMADATPYDVFSVFIDDQMWDTIVDQTNLYATQCLTNELSDAATSSRKHLWTPTTKTELKKLFGLIAYMGIVRMPAMKDYWSSDNFYHSVVCSNAMSRNRFELLLSMLHFADNTDTAINQNRLYKVQSLLDQFIKNCQFAFTPEEVFCIDESLIPFRGRLIMKQYIPQKAHRYGIKIFKLCCNHGYTWNMKIYSGKEFDKKQSVPTKVVMELSEKLLDSGRTVITDNYYTSLDLANKLLERNAHLVGTLRKNRKGIPKEILLKKLKKGEIVAQENSDGITILKWKDKRDVLMLSTKHTNNTVTINSKGKAVVKPKMVIDYNLGKTSIDISDQFSSYGSCLRKTIKWYRKVAIELILGTAIVNAHFIYKQLRGESISIIKFRTLVIKSMLGIATENRALPLPRDRRQPKHRFKKLPGSSRDGRKYCKGCYKQKKDGLIPRSKIKKVTTYCEDCDKQPRYCLDCFNLAHNI